MTPKPAPSGENQNDDQRYYTLALQVSSHGERLNNVIDRVKRLEDDLSNKITEIRDYMKENHDDMKEQLEKQGSALEKFATDIYNKINTLGITQAKAKGASEFSWKLIGAMGAFATICIAIGTIVGYLISHPAPASQPMRMGQQEQVSRLVQPRS